MKCTRPLIRKLRWLVPGLALGLSPAGCGGSAPARIHVQPAETEQAASPAPASAAPEQAASRGFFHEVRSESATVYLLGSVHIGREDLFPMDDPIEDAFAEATTLVLEIDLSEQGKMEAQEAMAQTRYPEGQSLAASLDAETLALLTERLRILGVPLEAVDHLRPWVVAMMMVMLEAQQNGYEGGSGVDLHFAERAVREKKRIVGLETAEEQLSLFTNMTEQAQALMLRQTLESADETTQQFERALAAWKNSDEPALLAALVEPMKTPEYQAVYDAVVVQRNVTMAAALDQMLRGKGTYFVVVGCAHVVGPDGIVARLRSAGHEVVQR